VGGHVAHVALWYRLPRHETIRILIPTLVPFLILVGVALLTRRDDKTIMD